MPLSELMAPIESIFTFSLVLAVIIVCVLALLTFLLVGKLIAPVSQTSALLKDIAEGEGDLTVRLTRISQIYAGSGG